MFLCLSFDKVYDETHFKYVRGIRSFVVCTDIIKITVENHGTQMGMFKCLNMTALLVEWQFLEISKCLYVKAALEIIIDTEYHFLYYT